MIRNNISILYNKLTAQEYLMLLKEAHWGDKEIKDIETALSNSLTVISLMFNNETIACARIVGDNKLCFYIQDVIVKKEYRNNGLATLLLEETEKYLQKHAAFGSFIGLMAAKGIEHLYEKFNYNKRPNDEMGCGMIKFWGRESSLSEK